MSVAQQIAEWTAGLRFDQLPPEAVTVAKHAMLDTIGCAVAGSAEPAVAIARKLYAGPAGVGVPLLSGGGWAGLEQAALIDGTAAHALDFDDVSITVTTHPSGVMVPVVLAVGQERHRSGKDVLTAYLIGVEVSIRVGEVMGFTHYHLGWHATQTLGTIGAAAAAGYLMGLPADQLQAAIAIAGSLAGGLRRNFGTMTKPVHVGFAAQNGIRAALFAEQGLTADADIFGPGGFYKAFSGGATSTPARLPLGEPFDVLGTGLSVKKYPCCYATHRLIDATVDLAQRYDLKAADVAQIEITAPPGSLAPLNRPRPVTGLEGKFSAEYTAAAALLDRKVNIAAFRDEMVLRPHVQELLQRVEARELPNPDQQARGLEDGEVVVTITTHAGERLRTGVATPPGSPQRPLTDNERWEKFHDCLTVQGRSSSAAAALFAAGQSLEQCEEMAEFSRVMRQEQ